MTSARPSLASRLPAALQVPIVDIPKGRMVVLSGRGSTYVTDTPGPDPDAPAILLLHAVSTTGLLTWYPSIPSLSKTFRVITMDQRLHGRGIDTADFTLADCADDAAAVLDALNIESAVIAGFSMGSLVAQRVWRQHADRVGGLILCASTDQFQTNSAERLIHRGMRAGAGVLRRGPAPAPKSPPRDPADDFHRWALGEFRSTRPSAVGHALAAISRHHSRPWIRTVDVPTAVVIPKRDKAIPPARQHAMARRIPGATVHEIDAGHSCCVMNADLFVPALIEGSRTVLARWKEAEQ